MTYKCAAVTLPTQPFIFTNFMNLLLKFKHFLPRQIGQSFSPPKNALKGSASFFFMVFALLLSVVASIGAENFLLDGDFEDESFPRKWVPNGSAVIESAEKHAGEHSMRMTQSLSHAYSPELIEVDPQAHYQLRAFIKEPEGKLADEYRPLNVILMLRLYDNYEQEIPAYAVHALPGTMTILSKDANQGADTIFVTADPSMFQTGDTAIAFNAMEDLSDIPNTTTSVVADITYASGEAKIKLAAPLKESYAKGTNVRQHLAMNWPSISVKPSSGWTEQVLDIGGVMDPEQAQPGQFWPGTRYVRVVIAPVIKNKSGQTGPQAIDLLVDDVSFTPMD